MACIVDSTVVGVSKPDPRIFDIALDAMGVAPEDAWYAGDTPAFDVVGARAAGLRPFLVDPFQMHLNGDSTGWGPSRSSRALVRA